MFCDMLSPLVMGIMALPGEPNSGALFVHKNPSILFCVEDSSLDDTAKHT